MTARQAVPACGSVIHFIFYCALATSQVHPKSVIVAWPHTWPASYPTLNTRRRANASGVGGLFSISMHFWVNSTSLSPLTLLSELTRSYMITINLSIVGRTFMILSVVGILDSGHIADVASSYASHALQAMHFPFPPNDEVRSHRFKAWNARRPPHLASPIAWSISVVSKYRNVVPVPNAKQRQSQRIFFARLMPMITTSGSPVLRRILCVPRSAPCDAYTNILVSASSCVQFISHAGSQGEVDNTSSSRVTITSPGHSSSTIRSLIGWNISDLFSSTRRNSSLLLGILACSLPRPFWYIDPSSHLWLLSGYPFSVKHHIHSLHIITELLMYIWPAWCAHQTRLLFVALSF